MNAPKKWLNKYVDLSGISDDMFAREMTFAGNKVEAVHKIKGETVFEFEITSNRPDTLSIIGLAREVAAIFDRKLTLPKIPKSKLIKTKPINLTVSDSKLCSTYSIVEISQVRVKPSSSSMQEMLSLSGIRPVNNIVDVSNYLLWEYAQLMHTFDADKIKGGLNLRLAKKGEVIITLDHKKRSLLGGEIIIEDKEKIVDLPGVMGALNTEITQKTNRVLLLVAIDNPVLVRRASKQLKLRSDSSTRSEKVLDLTQTELVASRAVELLEKESGGKQTSGIITKQSDWKPKAIKLDVAKLNKTVGIVLDQKTVDSYLKKVGVEKVGAFYVPPPWRRDLERDVDLIEEVSRLYGYNKLPRTIPSGIIPLHQDATATDWLKEIRNLMVALGYSETYSSTLLGGELINNLGKDPVKYQKVLHPMSIDFEYMRMSILESLIPLTKNNLLYYDGPINLFELGTVFLPAKNKSGLPYQPTELGGISTHKKYEEVKGDLEYLARYLNVDLVVEPAEQNSDSFFKDQYANILFDQTLVGMIGLIRLPDAGNSDLVAGFNLNTTALSHHFSLTPKYESVPTQSPIIEDLTFTLKSTIYLGQVLDEIRLVSRWIERVGLYNRFELEGKNEVNFTFRLIYRDQMRQLTDKELMPVRKKIVANLKKSFGAELVGSLG